MQGTASATSKVDCLTDDFRALAEPLEATEPFPDPLRNAQYRDVRFTKIPRAVRFNDRISMRSSTELRSPFLDHRLFELALRQPESMKLRGETRKWLPRRLAAALAPEGVVEAPKRPLQTPQREWLRGPLCGWAEGCIESGLDAYGDSWLRKDAVRDAWRSYRDGEGDNSYFVWQWVSLGLMVAEHQRAAAHLLNNARARSATSSGFSSLDEVARVGHQLQRQVVAVALDAAQRGLRHGPVVGAEEEVGGHRQAACLVGADRQPEVGAVQQLRGAGAGGLGQAPGVLPWRPAR